MPDLSQSPINFLLAHNALSVIFASYITRLTNVRWLAMLLSVAAAWCVTYPVRRLCLANEEGWSVFVAEPAQAFAAGWGEGTTWGFPNTLGGIGLLIAFVAPCVFAYLAAWQCRVSSTRSRRSIATTQLRLAHCFALVTTCGILIGASGWFDSGVLSGPPLVLVAFALVAKPQRIALKLRQGWWDERRLREVRERLRDQGIRSNEPLSGCLLRSNNATTAPRHG